MTWIALGIIAAAVTWGVLSLLSEIRKGDQEDRRDAERDAKRREADLLLAHGGWIEQHDLDRQVEIAIVQAYRDYDQYRGELR